MYIIYLFQGPGTSRYPPMSSSTRGHPVCCLTLSQRWWHPQIFQWNIFLNITLYTLYTLYTLQVEVVRFQLMYKLRQSYQEMCHSREGIDAPKESFNRWKYFVSQIFSEYLLFKVAIGAEGYRPGQGPTLPLLLLPWGVHGDVQVHNNNNNNNNNKNNNNNNNNNNDTITIMMFREIMNDIPMKLVRPKYTGEVMYNVYCILYKI